MSDEIVRLDPTPVDNSEAPQVRISVESYSPFLAPRFDFAPATESAAEEDLDPRQIPFDFDSASVVAEVVESFDVAAAAAAAAADPVIELAPPQAESVEPIAAELESDIEVLALASALVETIEEPIDELAPGNREFGSGDEDYQIEDEVLLNEIKAIPDKLAFKIGEVADLLGIKQYVLRYWEGEFEALKPKKSAHNQRMYSRRDVETAFMIKKLLYRDRFSIEGARKALRSLKKKVKNERTWESSLHKFQDAKQSLLVLADDIARLREKILVHNSLTS
jgi:DNA-binding transcriptional MerR regulator